jgi:hypothetical protein
MPEFPEAHKIKDEKRYYVSTRQAYDCFGKGGVIVAGEKKVVKDLECLEANEALSFIV